MIKQRGIKRAVRNIFRNEQGLSGYFQLSVFYRFFRSFFIFLRSWSIFGFRLAFPSTVLNERWEILLKIRGNKNLCDFASVIWHLQNYKSCFASCTDSYKSWKFFNLLMQVLFRKNICRYTSFYSYSYPDQDKNRNTSHFTTISFLI